jgi:outer membrane protein assembly factor BamB
MAGPWSASPSGTARGPLAFLSGRPGGGIIAAPALTPEALYVGDIQGNFYALDALSGEELWRFQGRGRIVTSPVVVGDRVVFRLPGGASTADGLLHAIE